MEESCFDILKRTLKIYSVTAIAKELNISNGTVKRWLLLSDVPSQYLFNLKKMLKEEIDYSLFSFKEKDQFYTNSKTALYCFNTFKSKIAELKIKETELFYIEPSAGDGAFLKLLPEDRRIGLDIEPKSEDIIKQDYFEWVPPTKNNVVIGNPPFGLRGHTALQFINHSYDFADFVVFILPQLFGSDGKGSPMKRVKGFNLIHTEQLENNEFEDPEGNIIKVNTIFQIWSKNYKIKEDEYTPNENVKIFSLSDGGTPSSTRNKNMLDKCDLYLPSTCFGENNMKAYNSFNELPNRKGYGIVFSGTKEELKIIKSMDWSDISFKSTNSALNLRSSIIEKEISKKIKKIS